MGVGMSATVGMSAGADGDTGVGSEEGKDGGAIIGLK